MKTLVGIYVALVLTACGNGADNSVGLALGILAIGLLIHEKLRRCT